VELKRNAGSAQVGGRAVIIAMVMALAACSGSDEDAGQSQTAATPAPAKAAPKAGKIAGSLSYPSDYLPDDLEVCAEETTSGEVTCKGGFKDNSYVVELPVGTYHVWARTDDYEAGYRAYYNEAVRCGLDVTCADRSAINVAVKAGETITGVDPADWYAP
jgi:hypothetical protein